LEVFLIESVHSFGSIRDTLKLYKGEIDVRSLVLEGNIGNFSILPKLGLQVVFGTRAAEIGDIDLLAPALAL